MRRRSTSCTPAIGELSADDCVRTIVIAGAGPVFCGGADVARMRAALDARIESLIAEFASAEAIAGQRVTAEAHEGLRAFLEHRSAAWEVARPPLPTSDRSD